MVAPGSRDARYERLAGDEAQRAELYVARKHLGFTIDEWLALPWWQRQVYAEGLTREAEEIEKAHGGEGGQAEGSLADTLLAGFT